MCEDSKGGSSQESLYVFVVYFKFRKFAASRKDIDW